MLNFKLLYMTMNWIWLWILPRSFHTFIKIEAFCCTQTISHTVQSFASWKYAHFDMWTTSVGQGDPEISHSQGLADLPAVVPGSRFRFPAKIHAPASGKAAEAGRESCWCRQVREMCYRGIDRDDVIIIGSRIRVFLTPPKNYEALKGASNCFHFRGITTRP